MKKTIKSVIILCLSIAVITSMCITSFANEQSISPSILSKVDVSALSNRQILELKNDIVSMTDKEFDEYIVALVESASNTMLLKNNLSKVGVELDLKNIAVNNIQRRVTVGNSTMSVYSAKRGGENYYRLYAETKLNAKETRPGSEDVIAMYFNSNLATYYGTNSVGNYTNTRDLSKRHNGTVVFNFDDKLAGTNTGISVVYVTPKSGTTGKEFEFGAVWTHTHTKTDISGSFNATISFGAKSPVEGSVGVTVNVSSQENSWQRDMATTRVF